MSEAKADGDFEDRNLYINRELSWLAFNQRVLDQARDAHWPLLERLKFLAIFASNLDEFFMIRVSGLHEQLEAQLLDGVPDGLSASGQLKLIRETVVGHLQIASELLSQELLPALNERGVRIRTWDTLTASERSWLQEYFRKAVFPVLTPLAVDPVHPFPFLSNLSLSLAVEAQDPETQERRFARIKVPEILPRFVLLGHPNGVRANQIQADEVLDFLPLEELIAHSLDDLFPGMDIVGSHPFRVTRDMDIEILEEEASDLLAVVDREVRRRRFGAAVRLEVAIGAPEHIRRFLLDRLELDDEDLYPSTGLLGFGSLMALAQLPRPDLRDPAFIPRSAEGDASSDPFAAIAAGDILLHHPYDSFNPVIECLRYAAEDPNVLAIKMTLYRTGSNAETVRALIRACENGKQVAVAIELKARFDEENNVRWARAMERAGVHVFYGTTGLKTHAKALLFVRREGTELRRYVHLSTGNYNATTAKLYTDFGVFTADAAIGEDVSELFNSLSGFSRKSNYRKLAVAPITLRAAILSKIQGQIDRQTAGKEGRIFAKLNSLVDEEVIRALYRASRAGVTVELVIRGICCLRPGIPGLSEHIRVRSLIGRFLEHERVLVFGPEGQQEFYLSSADWMPRNLDRRVELMFPILSEALSARIRDECLAALETDNCRVYELDEAGLYQRRRPIDGTPSVDAQLQTWNAVVKRANVHSSVVNVSDDPRA